MNGSRPSDHAWWLVSRASGLVALALLTLSVTIGLAMAARLGSQSSRTLLAGLHEQLALSTLVAIAVHGLTLLGDPWLHPGLRGIARAIRARVPLALHRGWESSAATLPRCWGSRSTSGVGSVGACGDGCTG